MEGEYPYHGALFMTNNRNHSMTNNRNQIQAIFFDFDGVLVESNQIKKDAFAELYGQFGSAAGEYAAEYHRRLGGISRVHKIRHCHEHLLNQQLSEQELNDWCQKFSDLVKEKVIHATWINGAKDFLIKYHREIPFFLISGTPQEELVEIIEHRQMTPFFHEVLGSPVSKSDHVQRLLESCNLNPETCYVIGDGKADIDAAMTCQTQFIGVQHHSTFPEGTITIPDCTKLEQLLF